MLSLAQKTFPTQVSVLQITKKETILQFGHKNKTLDYFFSKLTAVEVLHLPKPSTIIGLCEVKRAQPRPAKVRGVSDDIKLSLNI